MKYFLSVIAFLSSLFLYSNNTYAAEKDINPEPILIKSYQADITGDGQNEVIKLKGIPFSDNGSYYQQIWAEVTNIPLDKVWKINYGGGYDPAIQFVDLNHDQANGILYQSPTGESGELYSYQLYTLDSNKFKKLSLPKQRYVQGKFKDGLTIKIQITPESDPINIGIESRETDYVQQGIYGKDGNVLKPTSVMINPISFYEPTYISKRKGYGLKSYKIISGANHADQLGKIETLWYFENDKWIILQTKWVPTA